MWLRTMEKQKSNFSEMWTNWDKKTPEQKWTEIGEYLRNCKARTDYDDSRVQEVFTQDEELNCWMDDNEPGSITRFKKNWHLQIITIL